MGGLDGLDFLLKHVRRQCKNKSTCVHKPSSLTRREGLCRILARVPLMSCGVLSRLVLPRPANLACYYFFFSVFNSSCFFFNEVKRSSGRTVLGPHKASHPSLRPSVRVSVCELHVINIVMSV